MGDVEPALAGQQELAAHRGHGVEDIHLHAARGQGLGRHQAEQKPPPTMVTWKAEGRGSGGQGGGWCRLEAGAIVGPRPGEGGGNRGDPLRFAGPQVGSRSVTRRSSGGAGSGYAPWRANPTRRGGCRHSDLTAR